MLSGNRDQLHRSRQSGGRRPADPEGARHRPRRRWACPERLLLDLCGDAAAVRLVRRQGRRAHRAAARGGWWSVFTVLTAAAHERRRACSAAGCCWAWAKRALIRRAPRSSCNGSQASERAIATSIFDSGSRIGAALSLPLVALIISAGRLGSVVRRHRRAGHRLDPRLVRDLPQAVARRPDAANAAAPCDQRAQDAQTEGLVGLAVSLSHDLGHDDRLLLPELRDLFLHHLVSQPICPGARLLAGVARHAGHASRRWSRFPAAGWAALPPTRCIRRGWSLTAARKTCLVGGMLTLVGDHAVGVHAQRLCDARSSSASPMAASRSPPPASGRCRAMSRPRRTMSRPSAASRTSPSNLAGIVITTLHRRDAGHHRGLVHDSADRGGRVLLSGRVQLSRHRGQDRAAADSRRAANRCSRVAGSRGTVA